MILVSDIISEIKDRIKTEEAAMAESRKAGVNTPGFNQDFGARDALQNLLTWITEEDK